MVELGTNANVSERGTRLRALREALHLKQKDVAERSGELGWDHTYVSRCESGQNKMGSADRRRGLARGLGLPIEVFEAFVIDDRISLAEATRQASIDAGPTPEVFPAGATARHAFRAIPLPDAGSVGTVSLSERLQWILDHRDISASALSLQAGQSRAYVRKLMEREPTRPDFSALERIAAVAQVPSLWLIRGQGAPDGGPDHPTTDLRLERASVASTVEGSPLERALGHAFDPKRHLPRDLRAVQDVLGADSFQLQDTELDLIEKARVWLDAAASLRRAGDPISAGTLLHRVTVGKTTRAEEVLAQREAAVNAEAQAALDADEDIVPISADELAAEQALVRGRAGVERAAAASAEKARRGS